MLNDVTNRLATISPLWWGAIAGAMAAGATIFDGSKVIAAAGCGGLMLYLAMRAGQSGSESGCSDCAGNKPSAQTMPTQTAAPVESPVDMAAILRNAAASRVGCA